MKKIIGTFFISFFFFSSLHANFEEDSINNFKNSPSIFELESIKNPVERFCEEIYLEAYMRREFTKLENEVCSEIFVKKQEEEFLYKLSALENRNLY